MTAALPNQMTRSGGGPLLPPPSAAPAAPVLVSDVLLDFAGDLRAVARAEDHEGSLWLAAHHAALANQVMLWVQRERLLEAALPFIEERYAVELSGNAAQVLLEVGAHEHPLPAGSVLVRLQRRAVAHTIAHRIEHFEMPDPGPARRDACVAAMVEAWWRP